MIYDRKANEMINEKVYEGRATQFLYNTTVGGICLLLFRMPLISRIYGLFQKSNRSRLKIDNLIKTYEIETHEIETHEIETDEIETHGSEQKYRCFNDFIIRERIQSVVVGDKSVLIAPADSCLLAYTIEKGIIFSVKNKNYTLSRFLKNEALAREFEGGAFLIFRLRVYDNHRFCFVDNGMVLFHKRIKGFLDSVNRNATGKFTLSSNYREISHMQTANFREIIFAEVGAMLVGRIVQTHGNTIFKKGDEKGYFELGGSSIVLILKKGALKIDDDILAYSAKGIETKVEFGERIGVKRA
jgi:phosphatidylserine decarboxylase